jgi:hypothetical protein
MPSPSRLDRSENSPSLFDQFGLRIERGKSDQYGDAAARKIDQNYAITQSLPPARSFAIYNPCRQAAEAGFETASNDRVPDQKLVKVRAICLRLIEGSDPLR